MWIFHKCQKYNFQIFFTPVPNSLVVLLNKMPHGTYLTLRKYPVSAARLISNVADMDPIMTLGLPWERSHMVGAMDAFDQ